MATDIGSLFGTDPNEIQAQRQATAQAQAMKYASMDPAQQVNYGGYMAGNQVGNALMGMMGAKDPELEKASSIQSLIKDVDMTDLDAVKGLVSTLSKAGHHPQAMALLPRIDALTKTQEDREFKTDERKARFEELKYKQEQDAKARLEAIRVKAEADAQRAADNNASREQIAQIMAQARLESTKILAETRMSVAQLAAAMKSDKPKTAAELKAEEKKLAKEEATTSLDGTLTEMETLVDDLSKAGGMSSTKKNILQNTMTALETSGPGQVAGRVVGSSNQSSRDVLAAQKLRLLNDIKQATGMSAQEMNSNVELKLQLDSLGAPGMTAEANKKILNGIRTKFINKSKPAETTPPATGSGGWGIRPKTN